MEQYALMKKQVEGLLQTEPFYVSVLSNVSAVLRENLPDINWAGFYVVRNGRLVLGPFQGKVACIHIEKGKGVCGTAWEKEETILVPDVHAFPGHIACDAASRSEIVVPLHREGQVVAVMDIDSPTEKRFTEKDRGGLMELAALLEKKISWEGL